MLRCLAQIPIRCRLPPSLHGVSAAVSTTTPSQAKSISKNRRTLIRKVFRGQASLDEVTKLTESNKHAKEKHNMPTVNVWRDMSSRQLAHALTVPLEELLEELLSLGSLSYHIEDEFTPIKEGKIFSEIGKRFGKKPTFIPNPLSANKEVPKKCLDVVITPPKAEDLRPRPPVVAIMGHVDHGKTTLLDRLRKSHIVNGEFGGITQHIGAFVVALNRGGTDSKEQRHATFIDTPGHAAFKAMRSRGAHSTDIVILVVDACEGVLEQTLESIRMIKEAGAAMVVALNKVDKPNANMEKAKEELKEANVHIEEYGGDVQVVPISALTGTGVEQLIEAVMAQAELMQLSADPKGLVEGIVIEATVRDGFGKSATVLVQRGTLKPGQFLVCEQAICKVRVMQDDRERTVKEALPSQAVKVMGWRAQPSAGGIVNQVESDKRAKEVVKWRSQQKDMEQVEKDWGAIAKKRALDREEYFKQRELRRRLGIRKLRYGLLSRERPKESEEYNGPPKVSLIVKADVAGTVEAIINLIDGYPGNEVSLDLIDFGVGEVTQTDVEMAKQFSGYIFAFNCKVSQERFKEAAAAKVAIKEHNVIYKLVDDLKDIINSKLPKVLTKNILGQAVVSQQFLINVKRRQVPVAGCRVRSGELKRAKCVQVVRGGEVIYDGACMARLQHHKDQVQEITAGKERECGVMLTDESVTFEPGDLIMSYDSSLISQETQWDPGF